MKKELSKKDKNKNIILTGCKSAGLFTGDKVLILDNPNKDCTFNIDLTGKVGIIVYLNYDCGCGQSYPKDPMFGVSFANGKLEEYWKDEVLKLT
jgi:hypothetical protein